MQAIVYVLLLRGLPGFMVELLMLLVEEFWLVVGEVF